MDDSNTICFTTIQFVLQHYINRQSINYDLATNNIIYIFVNKFKKVQNYMRCVTKKHAIINMFLLVLKK